LWKQGLDQSSENLKAKSESERQVVRVVLVEDDFELRQSLTDFLRLNGFFVTSVGSGSEFASVIQAGVFDVAIVDLNLPDTNGFELTRFLTEKTDLGVIILTARTLRDDRIRGYAEGANLYFTKPVDGDELVYAVRNLRDRIRRIENSREPAHTSRPIWRIDCASWRLFSPQGIAIKLSSREAKMILCLAKASGRIVSRADLTSAMGYLDLNPETRSLDAVVRRLRSKARDAGLDLPIHVAHGAGVEFSVEIDIMK